MKKLFLIIGAPGSGKTTDAEIIAKNDDNITHYSTGNLLRDEVETGSDIGKKIDSFVSKGNLVPIEIVIETIMSAINSSDTDTVIIDGYPRSKEQMMALDEQLNKQNNIQLASVIEVDVSQDVAKERVLGRARGADDNEEVFYNRMLVYTDPLPMIQKFYRAKNLLTKINGERSIEEIVEDMYGFIKTKI